MRLAPLKAAASGFGESLGSAAIGSKFRHLLNLNIVCRCKWSVRFLGCDHHDHLAPF